MDETTEILAAIGAMLGALAAITPHIIPWFQDRNTLSRDRKRIELAKLEVDFISSWMSAANSFTSDDIEKKKLQAQRQLIKLLYISEQTASNTTSANYKAKAGIAANMSFFGYLGFYLFLLLGAAIDEKDNITFDQLMTGEDNVSMLLIMLLPLVGLYYWRRSSKAKDADEYRAKQMLKVDE